jgi:hypothetical protein
MPPFFFLLFSGIAIEVRLCIIVKDCKPGGKNHDKRE